MSDRERWIVYPLLFLSLGMSWHDKVTEEFHIKQIRCNRLRCEELIVVGGDDKPQVVLQSTKAGGNKACDPRGDDKLELVLGHKEQTSGLYAESKTERGPAVWSVLGNLGRFQPRSPIQWLSEFPLFDPQTMLDRAANAAPQDKNGKTKTKTKDDAKEQVATSSDEPTADDADSRRLKEE